MQNITRRTFVDRALKGSLLSLSFKVGGSALLLTPREARAKELPLQHLDIDQASMLELLGETIVPGSGDSGLVHFIDHQFGVSPDDCMLVAKFFQVEPPYKNFYLGGLSSMATAAEMVEAAIAAIEKLNPDLNAVVLPTTTSPPRR